MYCTLPTSGQVRHDMLDRLQSLSDQIKVTATIYKHISCDEESASCSGIDAVNMAYQIVSYLIAV